MVVSLWPHFLGPLCTYCVAKKILHLFLKNAVKNKPILIILVYKILRKVHVRWLQICQPHLQM